MMQYLPTGGFRWVRDEYSLNKLKNLVNNGLIKDDADEGYILRVKLRYSENLHTSHTDYPLAVERMKVKKEWLSPKQQELIQHSGQRYVPTEKLIPNLFDKDKYVVHYRNLQYYISQGMVLEHIYAAIKFDQSPWMKPYGPFAVERYETTKKIKFMFISQKYSKYCNLSRFHINSFFIFFEVSYLSTAKGSYELLFYHI